MFGPASSGLVNPMTTAGDIIYGTTGGSPLRLPIGSNGQILTLSSGLPAWQSAGNITTTSQSSTYSILTTDYLVICSGASWTMTLPTAVGVTGKIYQILHNGTSLSQVYTINTTSAQTVGGVASGSYALYTSGESLTIVSDGSNWQILSHETNTLWKSYTPTTQGLGSPTITEAYWKRVGDSIFSRGRLVAGTTTNVQLNIGLPATIDSTGESSTGIYGTLAQPGTGVVWIIATGGNSYVNVGSQSAGTPLTAINGSALLASSSTISWVTGPIPISGWQP